VVAALLIRGTYVVVERVLRWILPVFLAYVVTAFLAQPEWSQVLQATLLPHLDFSQLAVAGMLSLLGTTLTSYVYIWETIGQAHRRFPASTRP
jgi:Mn2+/Fe2+ NRAMP family transporter